MLKRVSFLCFLFCFAATPLFAQPATLPIEGFLTDAEQQPIDGSTEITFTIYDGDGGASIFSETISVDVENGAFVAHIGSVTNLDLAIFQTTNAPHVGIAVGGDDELTPTLPLGSVAYSAVAAYCYDTGSVEGRSFSDLDDAFSNEGHAHDFSELTNVPADIADGDDDTTYSASLPLAVVGNDLQLTDNGCAAGQVLAWDGNVWVCETPMPSNAVMFFNLTTCPTGWSDFAAANGRYVVAADGTRTIGGTVGSELTDVENRPVGQHSHAVVDPGHGHGIIDPGHRHGITSSGNDNFGPFNDVGSANSRTNLSHVAQTGVTVSPSSTGITVVNEGSVAGTNAPFIQLLACIKD